MYKFLLLIALAVAPVVAAGVTAQAHGTNGHGGGCPMMDHRGSGHMMGGHASGYHAQGYHGSHRH
jgi:hypothetical protein